MKIGGGFQFNDGEPPCAVRGEEVDNASSSGGKRRHLTINRAWFERRIDCVNARPYLRFQPRLRIPPIEIPTVLKRSAHAYQVAGELLTLRKIGDAKRGSLA